MRETYSLIYFDLTGTELKAMKWKKSMSQPTRSEKLRRMAEIRLLERDADLSDRPIGDTNTLIHELRVHQIELEMQNEELRQAQLDLQAALDKVTDLYDFAPIGYFSISDTGLILEANLMGATMLGMEREKLAGKRFSQFIIRDDQDGFYLHRQKLLGTHASTHLRAQRVYEYPLDAWLEV